MSHRAANPATGLAAGTAAYLWWGFSPLYFKLFADVPPLVILSHRIIWSVVFLVAIVLWQRTTGDVLRAVRDVRTGLTLCLTGLLVATNWGVFIYAVTTSHLLEASLGYFTNPLVNMLLGVTVLKERLRPLQLLAAAMALAALAYLAMSHTASTRHLWIPGALAFSFGFYALFRKVTPVSPTTGTLVETVFLFPLALLFLLPHSLASSLSAHPLLLTAGAFTAIPLLLFATAARSLRLTTVGFLQYLCPTVQFLLAVALYHEPFTPAHAVTFSLIWLALAIYTVDSYRAFRTLTPITAVPEPDPV